MFNIGCHLSTSKGYLGMAKEAVRIGADNFQFFTRNPRGARAKAIDPQDIAAFLTFAAAQRIGPILGHASYTLNPAATEEARRDYALEILADDLHRLEQTPGNLYNFHPGHHPEPDSDEAAGLVAELLNKILRPEQSSTVLLETMSGHGNELGGSFEQLGRIIERVKIERKVGICLDTCHVLAAGYDIVNDLDAVLTHFDRRIGLGRLHAVHLNDSQFPLGSRRDRHANIGQGHIGLRGFETIINHPALRELPFYLETHNDPDGYGREIALLRNLYRE